MNQETPDIAMYGRQTVDISVNSRSSPYRSQSTPGHQTHDPELLQEIVKRQPRARAIGSPDNIHIFLLVFLAAKKFGCRLLNPSQGAETDCGSK